MDWSWALLAPDGAAAAMGGGVKGANFFDIQSGGILKLANTA
jgi:hypothetical protein